MAQRSDIPEFGPSMVAEYVKPGENFADRYRVEHVIGSGGFARIYRAVQHDLDRPVALKVLAPNSIPSPSSRQKLRERFQREARILSRLRDPRTVTVYDFGSLGDDILYMVLEYIEGHDLATVIREGGRLPVDRARRITIQILQSLREVHGHGVLHRDIKPSNIMLYEHLGRSDNVKVLDFGVAKGLVTQELATGDLTADGAIIGTPRYMSPEQLNNLELRPASDLFGVGLVLYEMIAGTSPYGDGGFGEIYRRMLAFSDDLGPLDDLSDDLREVASGLLAPSLEERYSSATEALSDLGVEIEPMEAPSERESSSPSEAPASFPLEIDPSGATPSSDISAVSSIEAAPLHPSADESYDTALVDSDDVDHESPTVETPSSGERTPPEDQSTADREPEGAVERLFGNAARLWKWIAGGAAATLIAIAALAYVGVGDDTSEPEPSAASNAASHDPESGAAPESAAEERATARRAARRDVALAIELARSEAEEIGAEPSVGDSDEDRGTTPPSSGRDRQKPTGSAPSPDQRGAERTETNPNRKETRSGETEPTRTPTEREDSQRTPEESSSSDSSEGDSDEEPNFEMFDEL